MKLRNFFYLLLALPLFFAGCTEFGNDEPAKKEVNLTLSSEATLTFGAEGGQGTIAYKLENAPEGAAVTVSCGADWVANFTVAEAITFDVAANEGEARNTKVVVSYSDKYFEVAIQQAAYEPVITDEYLYDETLAYAQRVDLSEYGFPYNYYLIAFYTEDGEILLGTVIVGPEGENILTAGTYNAANGGLMMEGFELYIGEEEEYYFEGGDGEIVVGGDIDGYTFDIKIADVDGNKFHFTYEGVVIDMDPFGALPTEPVNLNAEYMIGEYYGTMYSATYNYYLVLSDTGFSAEGYALPGGKYYQLDLYGVEGEVDAEGYIHIPAGTYTFDANDSTDEWTIGNYYSGYFAVNAEGTDYDAQSPFDGGQIVVTADGLTLTVTVAGVQHTVTYNYAPKLYAGAQGGGDNDDSVEMAAPYSYAYYFGDQYTPGYADNYYLFLSDVGLDAEGFELPNGTYYRFDIYAPLGDGTTIPAGTYYVDMSDSGSPWTASLSYSSYYVLDEYGWDYVANDYPASGTIVVGEDGSIVAEVTMLMSGDNHIITYNGTHITIYDVSEGEGGEDDGTYSTLESDWNCNLSDHTLYYEAYGDWYEVGYQNWVIAIMPNSQEGDFVQFDILGGTDSSSFAGEYTISDSLGSYTAYPGYIDGGYMNGGWYYTEDGYTMAPFVDGWLDITDNGDGTFTVEFDVYDDCDYNITGKWTGELHPASELMQATRSNAKFGPSLVVAEQKPARSKESFRVVKPAQQSAKRVAQKGLKLR